MFYEEERSNPAVRIATFFMILMTLAGAFWAGFFPVRGDNDVWWHLKTGQYLWDYMKTNGFLHFPPYDVFTYTGADTPWVNHEWLSQMIFYAAYDVGGLQGAIIFKSLVLALTFALFILYMHRNGVGWKVACVGAVIALLASTGTIFLRPPIFTYLFIVIFLHIILSFQLGEHFKLAFIGAVVAEIVWVNLHGGAIIGIILISFWWLSELWFCVITWLKENPTAPSFKRLSDSTWVLLAVTAASFINPFTYHIHLLPFHVMGDRWLLENIGEMQSPNMQHRNAFELIILGLFCLPMLRAGSIWVYEGLAIVFFGHQALNHQRHIPLFALVATPPLMSALAEERRAMFLDRDDDDDEVHETFWGKMSYLVKWGLRYHLDIILVFLVLAYTFGLRPGKIWHVNWQHKSFMIDGEGYVPQMYPEDAVNFILYTKLEGPIFNHDNYAGYLIWRLSPETMKLFTDSRFDLWGSKYGKEELGVFGARSYPMGYTGEDGNWWGIDPFHIEDRKHLYDQYGEFDPEIQAWYDSGKPYWQFVLDKYDVNFILSYDITGIHYTLDQEYLGWIKIYEQNDGYSIHVRNVPKNAEILQKYALNHREHIAQAGEISEPSNSGEENTTQ